MNHCLKCQKEYIPKRIGGLFCTVSCGNAYRQQVKRDEQKKAELVVQGYAVEKPLTENERELWGILSGLGREASQIHTELLLPQDERLAGTGSRLARFVRECKEQVESPFFQELGGRLKAQQEAEVRVMEANNDKQQVQTS